MGDIGALRRAEKGAVVIDVGASCLRCGFSGEVSPREFLREGPAMDALREGLMVKARKKVGVWWSRERWLDVALSLFDQVFFHMLHTKPKERKVLLLFKDHAPKNLVWACSHALLNFFGVPSILCCSASGTALFATGVSSGLVIDCGERDVRCVAMVDGARLDHSFKSCNSDEASELLLTSCLDTTTSHGSLDEGALERIVLSSILTCTPELRPVILQNLVICGAGLTKVERTLAEKNIKLNEAFAASIRQVVDTSPEFSQLRASVSEYMQLFQTHAVTRENITWLGGSVAAGMEAFNTRAVTAALLNEYPYVFDSTDLRWAALARRRRLGQVDKTSELLYGLDSAVAAAAAAAGRDSIGRLSGLSRRSSASMMSKRTGGSNAYVRDVFELDDLDEEEWMPEKIVQRSVQDAPDPRTTFC